MVLFNKIIKNLEKLRFKRILKCPLKIYATPFYEKKPVEYAYDKVLVVRLHKIISFLRGKGGG